MADERTELGLELEAALLEAALLEAIAHSKGKLSLETRKLEPMSAARVKAIRKAVAKSPREFERKFGIPARTLEGWEQGRKLAMSDRILLTVIAHDPEAVQKALSAA